MSMNEQRPPGNEQRRPGGGGAAEFGESRSEREYSRSAPARQQGSRVLFAILTECTSGAGKPYLRGWAGASNLVGFRGEPDEQGRPTWNLYLTERQPKPDGQRPPRRSAGE